MLGSSHLMRGVMTAVMLWSAIGIVAGTARAHKDKLPGDALTLVQQASALLAQDPAMTGEVNERLQAALKSSKPQGVHLDQVREALQALGRQDMATARRLLMESIMPAGMPMPPDRPRSAAAPPPAPSPAPSLPAVAPPTPPSVDVALTIAEPLRVRFTGSRVEDMMLAMGVALIGIGVTSLWRSREKGP